MLASHSTDGQRLSIHRRIAVTFLVILAACPGSTARAAFPLVVDDAGVHPTRESEWVVSADALRTPATEALGANFSLAVGMLPGVEGSLGFGYGWIRDRSPADAPTREGALDLTLGIKTPIPLGEAAPFAFTLSSTVKLPTASARLGLGTGLTDLSVLGIATRTWGSLSLDINGGYTWTALGWRSEQAGDGWFTGAALRWQASRRVLLFAETYASLPMDETTDPTGTVRAGWQVEFRPGVLVAGAIGTGYGRDSSEALGTIGLTLIY